MHYILLTIVISIVIYLYYKYQSEPNDFDSHGIPQPPKYPIVGAMPALFFPRRHINDLIKYLYNIDRQAKYIGAHMFMTPTLYIRDLELVKAVLVKNFDHFADRKTFVDERVDPLFGQNLNFLNGDRWKQVRTMLSPAFTSSKMRSMYTLMSKCAENFTEELIKQFGHAQSVNLSDVFSKYANDVIASCAFGIELDTMKNPNNEFYQNGITSTRFKGFTNVKLMVEMMFPKLTRKLGMRIISKKTTDFFVNVIETTMKYRDEHGIVRPDMLQLMMEARSKSSEHTAAKYDLLEMTAQAFLFFLAGFEAVTVQTCLIFYELAVNPEFQRKVHEEIDEMLKSTNGKPTYEAINNMQYLDAVFSETLRKHPIAFLNRLCSKEFELPPAKPNSKPFVVKPGMGIMIPVAGIHSDPDIYEDPSRFDPDRFIDKKIMNVEVTNLSFGMGPRMCIGNRFAILEIKTLLVHLLAKCSFVPSEDTCIPLEYDKNAFAPIAKNGYWLKLQVRNQ